MNTQGWVRFHHKLALDAMAHAARRGLDADRASRIANGALTYGNPAKQRIENGKVLRYLQGAAYWRAEALRHYAHLAHLLCIDYRSR